MADRDQIKQVFFNLTKNAREAMQPGGKFKIRSRADDESVYLLFGDSGAGIRQGGPYPAFSAPILPPSPAAMAWAS